MRPDASVQAMSLKTPAQIRIMEDNARDLYRLFEDLHAYIKPVGIHCFPKRRNDHLHVFEHLPGFPGR